jgi:uncharacterized protein YndB with AHSA1/START domain/uncharacterized protein YciI
VSAVPPIRREVLVDADPALAFEVFTARIGRWWPLEDKSVYGAGASVAFTDGQLIERSAGGDTSLWGTVTRWEPPVAVAFTWHPGRGPESASNVEVTFAPADGQTLVTMIHTGWEAFADPAAARAMYDQGWPVVMDRYREAAEAADAGAREPHADGETWVALLHRPGPAAPQDRPLVEDPRFGDHVAFLTRMTEAGHLVAAGPLADAPGEGMTILRLPGADQLDQAITLATKDDVSVATGFLSVTVRPWRVMMQPGIGG